MRILCFDIGGTSIKYGIVEDDKLLWHEEHPTNAKKGGRFIRGRLENADVMF